MSEMDEKAPCIDFDTGSTTAFKPTRYLNRSPPHISTSNPDLPSATECRKRKYDKASNMSEDVMEYIDGKFLDFQSSINKTISAALTVGLTAEFTKITETLSEIKSDVQKLNLDNTTINQSLVEVKSRLTEVEGSLEFSSSRQDSYEDRLRAVESNISSSQGQTVRIQQLELTIDKMEQQARTANIEICNLPEKRGENLMSIISDIGAAIKLTLTLGDIVSIHRVRHADPNSTSPKNIIVRFTSVMLRDNILAAFRIAKGLNTSTIKITGPPQKIYLNEHLTLKNKLLLRKTREAASRHSYKYVWVRHATILVRKDDTSQIIAIRGDQDLNKISTISS
jgi:peptide deformylase